MLSISLDNVIVSPTPILYCGALNSLEILKLEPFSGILSITTSFFNTSRRYGAFRCDLASLIVNAFATTLNSSCDVLSFELMFKSTV